jgi:hypothetical protein
LGKEEDGLLFVIAVTLLRDKTKELFTFWPLPDFSLVSQLVVKVELAETICMGVDKTFENFLLASVGTCQDFKIGRDLRVKGLLIILRAVSNLESYSSQSKVFCVHSYLRVFFSPFFEPFRLLRPQCKLLFVLKRDNAKV